MWAAFSSTSPDMKVTKAFLSKKKDPEEEEEGGKKEIWRDVDRGKLREGPKEGKTLQGTLFIIEGAWGYDIEPYSIYPGRGGGPAGET